MKKLPRFGRLMRWVMVLTVGGVFVLSGCDPNVKSTILSGLETASTGLATTFITAFFQKLAADDTTSSSTSTALPPTMEERAQMLA